MSKILCIIDGMNDLNFDFSRYPALASFPIREYIKTVPNGFDPETLPCVLSLFGVDSPPKNIRGWIEALGADITINQHDLIFRFSWMRLDENGIIKNFCEAPNTIPELGNVKYVSLGDYRGLLILPEYAHLVNHVKTTMPFYLLGKNVHDVSYPHIPMLKNAITKLNCINPFYTIIPWSQSVLQSLPPYPQKATVVCGTNVIKGIAKALNMNLITTSKMTGDVDTNLAEKLIATIEAAKSYPFVVLHIGGCDEASHRMNILQKDNFLMKIDKIILSKLLKSNHEIQVVSDHGSDPKTGKHIGGKQPLFIRI